MKKITLTNLQKSYLESMRTDGPLMVGHQTPSIKRALDALVKKEMAAAVTIEGGWTRYSAL